MTRTQPPLFRRLTRLLASAWLWGVLAALLVYAGVFNPPLLAGLGAAVAALVWLLGRAPGDVIRPGDPRSITLDAYWGQPHLVALARQWLRLLSQRRQFAAMGGRFIHGVLLVGPPGAGKTLLARAMAGEAGLPLASVEGLRFRGTVWGADELRMRRFVAQARGLAREYGACLAYIDEVETLSAGALARLLSELDHLDDPTGWERARHWLAARLGRRPPRRDWTLLFLASAHRLDLVDPALLRPGRFDTRLRVEAPDRAGRRAIVAGYLSQVRHDETVDVDAIVEDTPQATPARLAAALTRDAVRLALADGRDRVSQSDIDRALQEQVSGFARPIDELDPNQRRQIAYHEAGHAVAVHYLMPEKRIVRATIVRHSDSLGHVLPVDRVDVYAAPLRRYAAEIVVSLAGHVATKLFMGEYWSGAAGGPGSDFSQIRTRLWQLYQLGYFGPPVLGAENAGSSSIPAGAAPLLERLWKVLEEQTEALLTQHAAEVQAIAHALLEKNELRHEAVMALLGDNGWQPGDTAFPPPREPAGLPALIPVSAALAAPDVAAPPVDLAGAPPPRMLTPPRPEALTRRRVAPDAAPPPREPAPPSDPSA